MQSKDNAKPAKPTAPHTGPDGQPETPKQKVERLRAQARAARMAQQSSGVDRWIESGRRFANRAHKGMVYSLIVASGTYRAFPRWGVRGDHTVFSGLGRGWGT